MTGWRFYPLAEHVDVGLLRSPNPERTWRMALFLTPEQAKEAARQKGRIA